MMKGLRMPAPKKVTIEILNAVEVDRVVDSDRMLTDRLVYDCYTEPVSGDSIRIQIEDGILFDGTVVGDWDLALSVETSAPTHRISLERV